jgi:hypothetical protein
VGSKGGLDFEKRPYPDSNSGPSVVQPVASRYTDRATAVPVNAASVSAVGIATGCGLDDRRVGIRVPVGSRIISSPRLRDRLWGPPCLLSNGQLAPFRRR